MSCNNLFLGENLEYIVVDTIEEATHWLAYKDDKSIIKDSITPNKQYKLEFIDDGFYPDYFIEDNNGKLIMAYMAHKGDYIKVRYWTFESFK